MYVEIFFRDIILMNPNLVIPKMKIQLGEKMSWREAHQQQELKTYP